MDAELLSLRVSCLRRLLADLFRGLRHWAANERARGRLRAEIYELDRAGLLNDVLQDLNMNRRMSARYSRLIHKPLAILRKCLNGSIWRIACDMIADGRAILKRSARGAKLLAAARVG